MGKVINTKKKPKPVAKKGGDKKNKLPRGYKKCGGPDCKHVLHIHKYVCDHCGFKH